VVGTQHQVPTNSSTITHFRGMHQQNHRAPPPPVTAVILPQTAQQQANGIVRGIGRMCSPPYHRRHQPTPSRSSKSVARHHQQVEQQGMSNENGRSYRSGNTQQINKRRTIEQQYRINRTYTAMSLYIITTEYREYITEKKYQNVENILPPPRIVLRAASQWYHRRITM